MIINLISGPRNVSTALMYAFAQRSDTRVLDEPFYGFYLKQTGIIHPGRTRIMKSMSTDIQQITDDLLKYTDNKQILFLKNMAHHHIDIDETFLKACTNVFLIRNPAELLVSFSKVIKDPNLEDIGIKKSWELYNHLVNSGQKPVVIDSGELLKDPEIMMKKLCRDIPIPYQSSMQSWPAGSRKEDGIWAEYWYHNLHKTTGFVKTTPKKVDVPESLVPICDEAMCYYDELYKLSIKYEANATTI